MRTGGTFDTSEEGKRFGKEEEEAKALAEEVPDMRTLLVGSGLRNRKPLEP
jgi:hypothetical protein